MRAAVLGSPIGHSRSPALHRAAYAALGLDWRYDAVECEAAGLAALLDSLDAEWVGLSLTMPLKQTVLPLLDSVSDLARDVAAANTVVLRDGSRHGHNTDVHGIVAALTSGRVPVGGPAVVIGGGATARSALAALRDLEVDDVTLLVRSDPVEALAAADRLGVVVRVSRDPRSLVDAGVVVSTVPAGAADDLAEHVTGVPLLLDVVYAPWPTRLAAGCSGTVVGGDEMLLHQAARQVELMTGRPAPIREMRAALG